jgi:hypothetical protein
MLLLEEWVTAELRYMLNAVPQNKKTTQRWDPQVVNALHLHPEDDILNKDEKILQ